LPDSPLNNIGSNAEFRANFQPFYNQMAIFQANSGPESYLQSSSRHSSEKPFVL